MKDLGRSVEPVKAIRFGGNPELEARSIARILCDENIVSLAIRVSNQSVLDKVVRSLIREGVSIFAADNKDDVVILYLARRDRRGCP